MVTGISPTPENSVLTAAEQRLRDSSHLFLRNVRCDYNQGRLQLDGKVPSFYLKQLAQSLVKDLGGVERVENRLTVVSSTGLSS